jgi:hypothetical protein
MDSRVKGAVPTFVMVTDCDEDVPRLCAENVNDGVLRLAMAVVVNPVPLNGRTRGLPPVM